MAEGRYPLATLAGHELIELGARVRQTTGSFEGVADGIVGLLEDTLRDEQGRAALALVRAYRTARFAALPPDLADAARTAAGDMRLGPDVRCLVLVATRGREPSWNFVARSEGHRVIPLPGEVAVRRLPMIARLLVDLGVPLRALGTPDLALLPDQPTEGTGVFYVAEAEGSPSIPAQRGFVDRHGIRSVVGCGTALPDDEIFVLVLFATVPIAEPIARGFEDVALQARLALLGAADLRSRAPELVVRSRVTALERLLVSQESHAVRQAQALLGELEAERERGATLVGQHAAELAAHTTRLERTERAMLNVIDDLRAAGSQLEARVDRCTAELERSNRELEELAEVASHDLQEPLRTIVGSLQLIEQRYVASLDDDARELIGLAVSGAGRMQSLVDDLLAYSRVTTEERPFEPVALDGVLDEAVAALAGSIEETGATILRDPLPQVVGDRLQLGQLLQNLLSNALEFAGEAPPRVEVRCARHDGVWQVAVRDHGIGFDGHHADSVFRVFRRLQRKYPGTGIGLAICKKVVGRHGGEIRAEATAGAGATFTFTLPVPEEPPS